MASTAQIELSRLAFIFCETNLGLLGNPQPPKVPLGFLGNSSSFAAMFDSAQQKGVIPMNLTPPWDKAGMHFWEFYLESKTSLEKTTGSTAWRFLVPFRGRIPIKQVTVSSLGSSELNCVVESFYYPHGFVCLVTFTITKTLALADSVALAYDIRKKQLDFEFPSGAKQKLPLKAFAAQCLDIIRESALGPGTPPGAKPVEPFTIFTVLKGNGQANDLSPLSNQSDEVRRVLEAVTNWPNVWTKSQLPAFDNQVRIALRSAAVPDDTLYARKRGRAVWYPDTFSDITMQRVSLGCYHRNLVLASMQTESLCGLATATVQQIKTVGWPSLPVMHRDCAQLAAGILGRLYGGDKATYRSLSPRYQIDQNGYVNDINQIRTIAGMKLLQ